MTDTTITYKSPTVRDNANLTTHITNLGAPSVTIGFDGLGPASTLTDAGYLSDRVSDVFTYSDVVTKTIFKNILETCLSTDILSHNAGIGKPLSDVPHPTDTKVLDFTKTLTDTATLSDSLTRDAPTELPTDTSNTTDLLSTTVNKVLEDILVVSESILHESTSNDFLLREDDFFILREDDGFFEREGVASDAQLETLVLSEDLALIIEPTILDTCSALDVLLTSGGTVAPLTQAIASDQIVLEYGNNQNEVLLQAEVVSKHLDKDTPENTLVNELVSLQPNKIISDSGTTSETRSFTLTKMIIDLVGFTENLVMEEFFILREDGTFILREDGTKLYREDLP